MNNRGRTLWIAAQKGRMGDVQRGLAGSHAADQSRELFDFLGGYRRATCLHAAAENGHAEVTEVFLQNGAPVDSRDLAGDTALGSAFVFDYVEVAEALLRYGAQLEARNIQGWTPLMIAVSQLSPQMVQVLLQNEAVLVNGCY